MRPAILMTGLILAACGGQSDTTASNSATVNEATTVAATPTPADPSTPPPVPLPTPSKQPPLMATGWGPLSIGMTRAQVAAALGDDANPHAAGGPDPQGCDEFHPARAPRGLTVMIEGSKLARIALIRDSTITTDKGLGLGASAAAVKAAYGDAVVAEPHKYEAAPAGYLTAWGRGGVKPGVMAGPDAIGIRYVIGGDGKVGTIYAGGPAIGYVEGCA